MSLKTYKADTKIKCKSKDQAEDLKWCLEGEKINSKVVSLNGVFYVEILGTKNE